MSQPVVLTAYSIDPDEQESVDEEALKRKNEQNKEMVLVLLVVFNALLLLTLIFLFLIPVHKGINCYKGYGDKHSDTAKGPNVNAMNKSLQSTNEQKGAGPIFATSTEKETKERNANKEFEVKAEKQKTL